MQPRIPITFSAKDRARLEILAAVRDITLSEAVRRAIIAEYERTQAEEVRSRIEDPIQVRLEGLVTRVAELEPLIAGTSLRLVKGHEN